MSESRNPAAPATRDEVLKAVTFLGSLTASQVVRYLHGPGWTEDEADTVRHHLTALVADGVLRADGVVYSPRTP